MNMDFEQLLKQEVQKAARQDYDAFYESEIRMRRLRRYPPFADLFTVTVSGTEEGRVLRAAVSVRETLRHYGGDIQVTSDAQETVFSGTVPKDTTIPEAKAAQENSINT